MADASYMKEYRKLYRKTERGQAVIVAGRRRWKKSERGMEAAREWARKKYVPKGRILLTPDERKQKDKESTARSLQKPEVRAKRRLTAWRLHVKKTYGLTAEQFSEMAKDGCHICGKPDSAGKRLHVDHCHSSGNVRGLLCDPCNRGIGCFNDDAEKIAKAIQYLRRA